MPDSAPKGVSPGTASHTGQNPLIGGEDTPGPEATLFDIAQFELDMEVLVGVPVSVTSTGGLDPVADRDELADAVPL